MIPILSRLFPGYAVFVVDRLCEQAITIAVQAEVCRQQAEELDRLRRAAKAHRRMRRKDSADLIAASINTREALRIAAGRG